MCSAYVLYCVIWCLCMHIQLYRMSLYNNCSAIDTVVVLLDVTSSTHDRSCAWLCPGSMQLCTIANC